LDLIPLLSEILLLVLALIVLGLKFAWPQNGSRWLGYITAAGLAVVMVVTFIWGDRGGTYYNGMIAVDGMSRIFKIVFQAAGALTALLSVEFLRLGKRGEYNALLVLAVLGTGLMAAAGDLVMIYVAVELTSISLYILVTSLRSDPRSSEAGLKYFLFGAFSSAMILYGMSLIYGLTGHTNLSEVTVALASGDVSIAAAAMALIFLVAGFGFKISAVPFHMWAPDVYEGAPTPITAFISVASKAAGFAILIRVFVGALVGLQPEWVAVMAALAVVTMTLGNAIAMVQTNIKRMLAYSSIAQAGYILVGLVAATELGVSAVMFYLTIYTFTNILAFTLVAIVAKKAGGEMITDFAGLGKRSPGLGVMMLLALLSLGGIPPLAGFVGKIYLFAAAVEAGFVWLVVIAVINSVAALFYYLMVARQIYIAEPETEASLVSGWPVKATMLITAAIILILGVVPWLWLNVTDSAANAFLM
jgi:NADH-quinone oxidoreductase subunit N